VDGHSSKDKKGKCLKLNLGMKAPVSVNDVLFLLHARFSAFSSI
jgi:hypothetical protein